jgi:hypothetical protein
MYRVRRLLVLALAFTLAVSASVAGGRRGLQRQQLKVGHEDIELKIDDDVKVRRQEPPIQYDDKGNPRKPTSEELRAAKGKDSRLPGYAADYNDLKNGQLVKVTVSKRRKTSDSDDKKEPSWKKLGELVGHVNHLDSKNRDLTLRVDMLANRGQQNTPTEQIKDAYATMIVILEEAKGKASQKK